MKKNTILYLLLLAGLFTACSEEEELVPSGYGKDWFALEDSSDPVDKACYNFYKETGISVFYNDTIGTETRVDNWGNTYTHYEILLFTASSLGGTEATNPYYAYTFCPKEYVVDGLEFLRENIVPALPESIKIRSFLLMSSMQTYQTALGTDAYKGLNTVLVSRIPELRTMSNADKKAFKGSVLNSVLATPIASHTEEMAAFYKLTRDCYADADLYGCSGWYFYNRYGFTNPDPRAVGFLKDPNPYDYGYMPKETEDIGMYVKAIFSYTPEEFEAIYGSFDIVMAKYNILKSVMTEIGVKF